MAPLGTGATQVLVLSCIAPSISGHGGDGFMDGHDDLRALFQPGGFYDPVASPRAANLMGSNPIGTQLIPQHIKEAAWGTGGTK